METVGFIGAVGLLSMAVISQDITAITAVISLLLLLVGVAIRYSNTLTSIDLRLANMEKKVDSLRCVRDKDSCGIKDCL